MRHLLAIPARPRLDVERVLDEGADHVEGEEVRSGALGRRGALGLLEPGAHEVRQRGQPMLPGACPGRQVEVDGLVLSAQLGDVRQDEPTSRPLVARPLACRPHRPEQPASRSLRPLRGTVVERARR